MAMKATDYGRPEGYILGGVKERNLEQSIFNHKLLAKSSFGVIIGSLVSQWFNESSKCPTAAAGPGHGLPTRRKLAPKCAGGIAKASHRPPASDPVAWSVWIGHT
jgi:hypothetical protein